MLSAYKYMQIAYIGQVEFLSDSSQTCGYRAGMIILRLFHLLDLDVTEEDGGAGMLALETDPPLRGQLREGPAQPGRDLAPVGVRLGRRPQAHVHLRDTLAVEDDGDLLAEAGDRVAVPFARLLDDALRRSQMSEDRSAVPGGWFFGPLLGEVVGDLDLDGVRDPIRDVGTINDDAAVCPRRRPELEVEREILVIPDRPDGLVFRSREDAVGDGPDTGRELGVGEVGREEVRPAGDVGVGGRCRRLLGRRAGSQDEHAQDERTERNSHGFHRDSFRLRPRTASF